MQFTDKGLCYSVGWDVGAQLPVDTTTILKYYLQYLIHRIDVDFIVKFLKRIKTIRKNKFETDKIPP